MNNGISVKGLCEKIINGTNSDEQTLKILNKFIRYI